MVAKKQHTEHKRTTIPRFLPFVVSDCGELSPTANEVEEWLVEQFRRKVLKCKDRADGCTTSELVHRFRHKLKIGVQEAITAGLGSVLGDYFCFVSLRHTHKTMTHASFHYLHLFFVLVLHMTRNALFLNSPFVFF